MGPSSTMSTVSPTELVERSPPPQHVGQKRKASVAGIGTGADTGPGPVSTNRVARARFFSKRRAAKACQCCRARKVRCNVTEHGAPCTNCRLDEVECIVSEGRRKRKMPDMQKKDGTIDIIVPESRKKEQHRRLSSHSSIIDWLDDESNLDEHVQFSTEYCPREPLELAVDTNLSAERSNMVDPALTAFSSSFLPEADQPFINLSMPQMPTAFLPIPKYVNPIPERIGSDEMCYLSRKGALYVPDGVVLTEMLRCFVEFVHHSNPVIELHGFLAAILSDGICADKVSLLVLQAVFYASSAFVDMQHLRSLGYRTRKEARQNLYNKVKLLYEFDYESDRQALVQALLLITDHYERPNDLKDAHYWLSVVVSIAKSLGLQQNPDEVRLSAKNAKLRKRLWWSLVTRDRLVALGMRRPTLIKSEDHDVLPLTEDDLQFYPIPEHLASMLNNCESARDATAQRRLALLYIEKVRLCTCIGDVLQKTYCVTNESTNFETDKTTMMLRPKTIGLSLREVRECHDELHDWLENLPVEIALKDSCDDKFSDHASVSLSRALLHMLFHAAVSALHRPQVLLNNNGSNYAGPTPPTSPKYEDLVTCADKDDMIQLSRRSIRCSTSSITAINEQLLKHGLARFLPVTGITVSVAAAVIHLLDLKSPTSEVSGMRPKDDPEEEVKMVRAEALKGFCTCMSVMNRLSEKYAAADVSIVFLDAAVRRARIRLGQLEEEIRSSESSIIAGASRKVEKDAYASSAAELLAAGQRILGLAFISDAPMSPPPASLAGLLTTTPQYSSALDMGYSMKMPNSQIINNRNIMAAMTTRDNQMRDRVTLSSLTPPPEESLPFAPASSDPSKQISTQEQQEQQHLMNVARQAAARANLVKTANTTTTTTTAINNDEKDMARRLERYLAGVPFSSPQTPSASSAAEGASAAGARKNSSETDSETLNLQADTGISAGATGLPGRQLGDMTDASINDSGSDVDSAAAFYGQLESDFDALIDMSAAAVAGTVEG